jgi:predicted protein tyrosine phosphatase
LLWRLRQQNTTHTVAILAMATVQLRGHSNRICTQLEVSVNDVERVEEYTHEPPTEV